VHRRNQVVDGEQTTVAQAVRPSAFFDWAWIGQDRFGRVTSSTKKRSQGTRHKRKLATEIDASLKLYITSCAAVFKLEGLKYGNISYISGDTYTAGTANAAPISNKGAATIE
jgi:hypothetical protein